MKDKRYANRGQAFEEFIRYANSRYEKEGMAMITKIPTEFIPLRNNLGKIVSAKVEHKSTVDFIGRYKSYPIAIEAKNSNDDSIRWDRLEPHQVEFMNKFTQQTGTIGIVLVSFNLKTFYAIPWKVWKEAYRVRIQEAQRAMSAAVEAYGTKWTIPAKKSVREAELSPEWKVTGSDSKYGLHYLTNADRYIKKN